MLNGDGLLMVQVGGNQAVDAGDDEVLKKQKPSDKEWWMGKGSGRVSWKRNTNVFLS